MSEINVEETGGNSFTHAAKPVDSFNPANAPVMKPLTFVEGKNGKTVLGRLLDRLMGHSDIKEKTPL